MLFYLLIIIEWLTVFYWITLRLSGFLGFLGLLSTLFGFG